MKSWVLLLSHFLHVLGAIAWIGGILMIIYVILPSSKATIESTPMVGKLMKEVARRFTPLANISIFMLIGTGIVIASYDGSYSSIRNWNGASHVLIIFKIILVGCMAMIHFCRSLILNPKIEKLSAEVDVTRTNRLKKLSFDLVKANFVLGMAVLLLTASIISQVRHLR